MTVDLTRERYIKLTSATLGWCNARRGDLQAPPLTKLEVHIGDSLLDIIDRNFPEGVTELELTEEAGGKTVLTFQMGDESLACLVPPIATQLVTHVATSYEQQAAAS
jgi:hypothetical protein